MGVPPDHVPHEIDGAVERQSNSGGGDAAGDLGRVVDLGGRGFRAVLAR